jgi:uncharacterized protein YjbJ (UPF0337 family)
VASRTRSAALLAFAARPVDIRSTEEHIQMAIEDKAAHKVEDLKGKAKETAGKATDDESLEAEGKADQSKSSLKQAGENIKDAFKG